MARRRPSTQFCSASSQSPSSSPSSSCEACCAVSSRARQAASRARPATEPTRADCTRKGRPHCGRRFSLLPGSRTANHPIGRLRIAGFAPTLPRSRVTHTGRSAELCGKPSGAPPTGGGPPPCPTSCCDRSSRCRSRCIELREREDGQTTTEYAILLGFLAIAIIIALFFLRNVLRSLFSSAASSVSNAPGG